MKEITFAVAGLGARGPWLTKMIADIPGVRIEAVCDLYEDRVTDMADTLAKKGLPRPAGYTDYRQMLAEHKTDAILVSTAWEAHVEVAVAAMEEGIAVALEVGGAYSADDCWNLVDTWERTHTPFMFMENCCYGKEELLATSLVRNGRFGEIVYCHGAYAHDLREEIAYGDIHRHYRLRNYSAYNRENYPTHELGPIARLLGINRGNRMVSLVSLATKSRGLHAYVQNKPQLEYLRDRDFAQGDIVRTVITCENGELIDLTLDTTLPRFYSREFTVRGTEGMYNQDNNMVLIEGKFQEGFDTAACMARTHNNAEEYASYLPDIWKNVDEQTLKAGHGGMDWFEFVAFIDALREGKPMPIDVYDAASWMAVSYLSAISVQSGGAPVEIPDFTRGKYKTRPVEDVVPLPHITDPAENG